MLVRIGVSHLECREFTSLLNPGLAGCIKFQEQAGIACRVCWEALARSQLGLLWGLLRAGIATLGTGEGGRPALNNTMESYELWSLAMRTRIKPAQRKREPPEPTQPMPCSTNPLIAIILLQQSLPLFGRHLLHGYRPYTSIVPNQTGDQASLLR